MKIAITSDDFRTVTGHAGRATRFLVYEVAADGTAAECARLDLAGQPTFHQTGGAGAHPIDGVDVLLSAGFGAHFGQVMASRGIQAAATDRRDPAEAVHDYLARRAAGAPMPASDCGCGCDHHEH